MVSRKSPANIIISKEKITKGILNITVNFENDSNLHVLKLTWWGINIVNADFINEVLSCLSCGSGYFFSKG